MRERQHRWKKCMYCGSEIEKAGTASSQWMDHDGHTICGDKYHMPAREILLSNGMKAIVDEEDFVQLNKHKWCAVCRGHGLWYAHRVVGKRPNRKWQYMHHAIIDGDLGEKCIDHINHNGLDNRRVNLRVVTRLENNRNSIKRITRGSSTYRGVSIDPRYNKWRARYSNKWLGWYDTEIEAAMAYDSYVRLVDQHSQLNLVSP